MYYLIDRDKAIISAHETIHKAWARQETLLLWGRTPRIHTRIVKALGSSGDADWLNIDGTDYGISTDNVILDHDGLPYSQEWIGQNVFIVDLLNAVKTHQQNEQ